MLTKRIIACLDIQNGRTVKGTNFLNLRDAGDPVELGARYARKVRTNWYSWILRLLMKKERR